MTVALISGVTATVWVCAIAVWALVARLILHRHAEPAYAGATMTSPLPIAELTAVDVELPDVDLIRSAEEITVVHDALSRRLDTAMQQFRAAMDAISDDLCGEWWFRRLDDDTFERVRNGADVPGAFRLLPADPDLRTRAAAGSCYIDSTGEWDLSELRAKLEPAS